MKHFIAIVLLSWSDFVLSQDTEQMSQDTPPILAGPYCAKDNYRDFIFQDNDIRPRCNLHRANLQGEDLQGANLRLAILHSANL